MQQSLYYSYSNILMNSMLRQEDAIVKFDDSQHLTFEIDGTWFPADELTSKGMPPVFSKQVLRMPRTIDGDRDLQLFVHEHSLRTAWVASLMNSNIAQMRFSIHRSDIQDLVEGIEEAYGDHEKLAVVSDSDYKAANVKISQEQICFSVRNNFKVLNPYSEQD